MPRADREPSESGEPEPSDFAIDAEALRALLERHRIEQDAVRAMGYRRSFFGVALGVAAVAITASMPMWVSILTIVAGMVWVLEGLRRMAPGRCIICRRRTPVGVPQRGTPDPRWWRNLTPPPRRETVWCCLEHLGFLANLEGLRDRAR